MPNKAAASKTFNLSLEIFDSTKSRSSHPKTCKTHKSPKEDVQKCHGEIRKANKENCLRWSFSKK